MIKRNMLLASAMFCSVAAFAGTEVSVYQGNDVSVRVLDTNSKMKFSGGKIAFDEGEFAKIDSVILNHYVSVKFDGDKVTVSNPFDNDSVDIKVDGSTVEIKSNFVTREIEYKFSGKSSNGNVVFSSLYKSKFELNNLDLTSNGVNPPILVLTKKNTEVNLVGNSMLTDSKSDTVGATMRGKGQFVFVGDGSLEVVGAAGHGIQSSDYVEVKSGKIVINAASDGIHVNDYYLQSGGDVNIVSGADGVDVGEGYAEINGGTLAVYSTADEARGIRCTAEEASVNNDITISGGTVNIQLLGKGARGLKTDDNVNVDGGDVLVVMSGSSLVGDVVDGATDYTYTCGVKADGSVNVESGKLVVICKSSAYSSRCVQADASVNCNGGITALNQASGIKVEDDAKKPYAVKVDGYLNVASSSNLFVKVNSSAKAYNVDGIYMGGSLLSKTDYEEEIMPNANFWNDYASYLK